MPSYHDCRNSCSRQMIDKLNWCLKFPIVLPGGSSHIEHSVYLIRLLKQSKLMTNVYTLTGVNN